MESAASIVDESSNIEMISSEQTVTESFDITSSASMPGLEQACETALLFGPGAYVVIRPEDGGKEVLVSAQKDLDGLQFILHESLPDDEALTNLHMQPMDGTNPMLSSDQTRLAESGPSDSALVKDVVIQYNTTPQAPVSDSGLGLGGEQVLDSENCQVMVENLSNDVTIVTERLVKMEPRPDITGNLTSLPTCVRDSPTVLQLPQVDIGLGDTSMETITLGEAEAVSNDTGRQLMILKCQKCRKTFLSLAELKLHELVTCKTRQSTSSQCDQCGKVFLHKSGWEVHQSKLHRGVWQCCACHSSFCSGFLLVQHREDSHAKTAKRGKSSTRSGRVVKTPKSVLDSDEEEKDCRCSFCGLDCGDENTLRQHLELNADEEEYECRVCSKVFLTRSGLKKHLQSHVDAAGKALVDGKPKSAKQLCDICGVSFPTKYNLSVHKRSIHERNKPFACSVCQRVFSQKGNLKSHMRTHTGEKPFVCTVCGRAFAQQAGLDYHVKTHDPEPIPAIDVPADLVCRKCDRQCYTETSYLSHYRKSHTGVKPYSCKTCGKAFRDRSTLSVHMRKHEGNYLHFCEVCGKGFYRLYELRMHRAAKHGAACGEDQRYTCELCNMKFCYKHQLTLHVKRTHEKSEFFCKVCFKPFGSAYNLRIHMGTHSQDKQYKCRYCDRYFTDPSNVLHHQKRMHKGYAKHSAQENAVTVKRFDVSVTEIVKTEIL